MINGNMDINSKEILVIGDVMLDEYYQGDVNRISPEAPTPIFSKKKEYNRLGGVGNVAINLMAAEQRVTIACSIGKDDNGKLIRSLLEANGINTDFVIETNKVSTTKTRLLASNNQQVIRIDCEDDAYLGEEILSELTERIKERISTFKLILFSDYMKGFLEPSFMKRIINLALQNKIPVIVDVKDTNIEKYRNVTILKPNQKELSLLTGIQINNESDLLKAAKLLQIKTNCKYVLTTCGAKGMVLFGDQEPYFVKAVSREVYDVTGAGDTSVAYLAACYVNGLDIRDAVDVSNLAAGVQVLKVGTGPVYWKEIFSDCPSCSINYRQKILNKETIVALREKNENKKIVFTNGCFDIIHIGHLRYLQAAKEKGDILVIGLNSDKSVERLKGIGRPIIPEEERAETLAALGFVDYVVIFEEDTPIELIKIIHPDVLVKGGDYEGKEIVGKNEVEEYGGIVELIPFVEGKSTTQIVKRIQDNKEN